MNPWRLYDEKMRSGGHYGRDAVLRREQQFIRDKLPKRLSYKDGVVINGTPQNIAIIDSDDFSIKTICSLPGEDIPNGGLVEWAGGYWLITEKNADTEVYSKGTMQQCNHLLRWVDSDGEIIERWCIVSDGTKYLVGEWGDNDNIVTRGDMRVSLIIARDRYTVKLNRENRFLIDDGASPNVIAYRLTKPFKMHGGFSKNGVLAFVLSECNTEDTDNMDLRIANYYKFFPRDTGTGDTGTAGGGSAGDGKKVWI